MNTLQTQMEMDLGAAFGTSLDPTRRHVVLAEDDTEMRRLLSAVLSVDGYDVTPIRDGAELLDFVRAIATEGAADEPHVIVTDNRMPGFSGLDAVEVLRLVGSRIPVLVVTAFGDAETHERAASLDAVVLDKPFEMQRFREAVLRALSREPVGGAEVRTDGAGGLGEWIDGWLPVRRREEPLD